ncbi:MAG TPA: DUF3592 domain-containing protein [Streptosporangiaceae bacterium]|nr:DUF3592 domain-containing protein [Streptosporangiaceae bacterium]
MGEESRLAGPAAAGAPAGPAAGAARPAPGYRRLARWAAGRACWAAASLVLGLALLGAAGSDAAAFRALTGSAVATVVASQTVATDVGASTQYQLEVTVRFAPPGKAPVQTTVEPSDLGSARPGERLPVRYDPAAPDDAAYNGPGGDAQYSNGQAEAVMAWVLIAAAAGLLLAGAARLTRMRRAVTSAAETEVSAVPTALRTSNGTIPFVRIHRRGDPAELEWRLLPRQPAVTGTVSVRPRPAPGRWLVTFLPDGRALWPASAAQPVLGAGPAGGAAAALAGVAAAPDGAVAAPDGAVAAHRRLLAGYARLLGMVDGLPLVTRRPPGAKVQPWWLLGAPRPAVRLLVAAHLRRRLRKLAAAEFHAAAVRRHPGGDEDDAGRLLYEAGRECRDLADTLPRRPWAALASTVVTTGLAVYSPFFPTPRFHVAPDVSAASALLVILVSLAVAVIPLFVFFRSVRCKRALFSPAPAAGRPAAGWDVYRDEAEAFGQVGRPAPREWEAMPSLRWTVGLAYGGTIGVVLLLAQGPLAVVIPAAIAALIWLWQRVAAPRLARRRASRGSPAAGPGGSPA